MAKSGQARVLSPSQFQYVLEVIEQKRHPEKNSCIMNISFKLGLRVQEISLLQIKEVAKLSPAEDRGYRLLDILSLPASYTKGANAHNKGVSKSPYNRRVISFKVDDFDNVVSQIVALAKAGADIDPSTFYPAIEKRSGTSRDLPMVDQALRESLFRYLDLRISKDPGLKPTDPLFVTQKSGPYSPNTLQDHMALILKEWAGIEKASSHSGRRSVATDILHGQKQTIRVAQKALGHKTPATTVLYDEPPEEVLKEALKSVGSKYKG